MSTRLDLDRLKNDDYFCYQIASRASGKMSGWCEIDIGGLKIGPEARFRLAQASLDHEAAIAAAKRAAAAPPPPPAPTEPQINFAEVEAEQQREIQTRADEAGARNRLDQYANEQGLEPSDHNVNLIRDFVNNSAAKGYWSREIVDVAISRLRSKLTWKPKEAPTPEPVGEILGTLKDGSKRLPLNATNTEISRATKEQAKDWLARNRAARRPAHNVVRSAFNIF